MFNNKINIIKREFFTFFQKKPIFAAPFYIVELARFMCTFPIKFNVKKCHYLKLHYISNYIVSARCVQIIQRKSDSLTRDYCNFLATSHEIVFLPLINGNIFSL